jgi:hypothetical protein
VTAMNGSVAAAARQAGRLPGGVSVARQGIIAGTVVSVAPGAASSAAIGGTIRDPADRAEAQDIRFQRSASHFAVGAGPCASPGRTLPGWRRASCSRTGSAESLSAPYALARVPGRTGGLRSLALGSLPLIFPAEVFAAR